MWKKIKPYVISVAIALGVGALSAILTRGNMTLPAIKPPLTPPEKAFPFVWSVLFILMGIGAALIYKDKYRDDSALGIYALQLVINFFWSIIFFNMQTLYTLYTFYSKFLIRKMSSIDISLMFDFNSNIARIGLYEKYLIFDTSLIFNNDEGKDLFEKSQFKCISK